MEEQSFLSITLAIMLAAFVVGVSLREQRAKLNAIGFAAVLFVFYGVWNTGSLREGLTVATFSFVLVFFMPYSFGAAVARRVGRSGK